MAEIIRSVKVKKVHKEHKCSGAPNGLDGFFSFSDFCPICGEPLLHEKPVTERTCSACKKILIVETPYCPNCGAKFDNWQPWTEPVKPDRINDAFKQPVNYLIDAAMRDPASMIALGQLVNKGLKKLGIKLW